MNVKKIYAAIAVVGCILMVSGWASAGFSFGNLFADKAVYTEVKRTETLGVNDTVEIKTDVETVRVGRSPDGNAHVSYFDSEEIKHSYTHDGGVLYVGVEGKRWYEHINFSINFTSENKVIEVLLPAGFAGELQVEDSTGDVTAEQIKGLEKIDLSVTTGDLHIQDCDAKEANLDTTTGWLSASGLAVHTLSAESTTGTITLSNATCETIDVHGTTGDIVLDRVIGNDITLDASTGSITGSIACAAREFTVESSTSTGENNLKNVNPGGPRKLSAQSTTGNIHITFDE